MRFYDLEGGNVPGPGFAYISLEEKSSVQQVLENWQLTRKTYDKPKGTSVVQRFEDELQKLFNSPYSVAVNSGTSALLAALAALEIGPGDEVIVPGYTFIASIGSIVHSGAVPVLGEIDQSLTLDPDAVSERITDRTKAIMCVHMLGAPCKVDTLRSIADRHGLALIEDVAQACGATYKGSRLGTVGDAGAFSLNLFKVITSGEGGFLLTRNKRIYQRAYSFHDQGWFPLQGHRTADRGDGDLIFGVNLRMGDLAGAVALAQLGKLDQILSDTRAAKRKLVELVPERSGMNRRIIHDAGECGTLLVYIFDEIGDARKVAGILGTKTLDDSGHHNYANMAQLAAYGRGEVSVSPVNRNSGNPRYSYELGALPRTDDILQRSIALSVGVSDSYLGAGFGISVMSGDAEIERVAEAFVSAVDQVLGRE